MTTQRTTIAVSLLLVLFYNDALAWAPVATSSRRMPRSSSKTQLSAVSLNVASAMTAIDTFWQTSPYTAAAIVCGFKASAADMVAQQNANVLDDDNDEEEERLEEGSVMECTTSSETPSASAQEDDECSFLSISEQQSSSLESSSQPDFLSSLLLETDYKRNVAFLLYGSLYQGISQEYIYNTLYPLWFGPGTELSVVISKVAFDLLVQTPLLTLPMAYLIKGAIFGQAPRESLTKYVEDIVHQELLQKYWMLWGPVGCFTFGVVPEHYRVTFIACVSFFWLIILSNISSKQQGQGQQQEA